MSFHTALINRGLEHNKALELVESKLDEKHAIMSLDIVKEELELYHKMFKEILKAARD
jgi:hypothetical protein